MSVSLIVGIDMAKKSFTAAYRIGEAGYDLGNFANTPSGYEALHRQLNNVCKEQGMTRIHLVLEATGGYEAALLAYAYGQEWAISMPNPLRVRRWAEGVGYRVKTDRVDARILAHHGVDCRPPLRPQLAVEVSEMDSLLKRRLDLEQARQKEQTRLSELTGRPGISPKVQESLQQVIDALSDALAEIEQAIEALQQRFQPFAVEAQRLLPLPGVGPKVLWPLVVKLMQFHNLTSGQGDASAFVAFIGLDPQPHISGSSVNKHPGISKMGDSELRRLLYMGALGAISGDNPLRIFYRRLLDRGKAKKVAL
ncbi:MAG: transposase, partial [Caldilineaceae bacterium]|nr:transposase [Caldilineaceae bacterium]